jgi:hypothetical protein
VPIATTCANGFAGNISIASYSYGSLLAVSPPQFSAWSFPCGSSTTITLNVYPGAQPSYYQVTVTASAAAGGQSVQHSTTVPVSVVNSQASGLVATPYAQTVVPGAAASFSVAPILTNGFTGTITLSCSSPSSLCPSVTFNPPSFSTVAGSTMTVTTAANTPPGAYTINVNGTSPGQNTVSTSVALTVSSTTVLTLSPSLPPPTVPANGQPVLATYNFSSGNPNWLNGGVCTSADSNISAQITQYGSSSVGINVAVGAGDHNSSGTIDCTCPGGGGGTIHPPIIISPAPVITSVTDAAGDQPAVLYAGGTATITINGANFGSAGGLLNFCPAGTNPCVLPGNATPMSYDFSSCAGCTWTDNQIVTTVTLPSTAPAGAWQMFVISLAWVVGGGYTNPSMGNLDVESAPQLLCTPATLTRGGSVSCTVSSGTVTQWSFSGTNSAGTNLTVTSPSGGSSWSGVMVLTGTVTATVQGVGNLTQVITVNPRSNFSVSPVTMPPTPTQLSANGTAPMDNLVSPSDQAPQPTMSESAFIGKFTITTQEISGGPNDQLFYVTQLTDKSSYIWELNPGLTNTSDPFYLAQGGAYGTCWAGVPAIMAASALHEYGTVPGQSSHYTEVRDFLQNSATNPGTLAESAVAAVAGDLNNIISNAYAKAAAAGAPEPTGGAELPTPINYPPYTICQ